MEVSEHASELERWLIAAYRATRFRVDAEPPFALTVDVRSPELEALLRADDPVGAAYVTAWNPKGELLSTAQNEPLQQRLVEEVRAAGWRWLTGAGTGSDSDWPEEPSLLVLGIDRRSACQLGRDHDQNAILWSGADAVPRLVLLR